MTYEETKWWLIENGAAIGRLAKQGDKLALRLIQAHHDHIRNKLNPRLQDDLIKVADDFCRRDLTVVTRVILQNRYGHKVPRYERLKAVH